MAEIGDDEVAALAAALSRVSRGLELARRRIPAAGRLAALQVIKDRGPIRPSGLAAELDVHQSLATRQVQALEDAGLVAVEAAPDDRRAVLVSLTEAGERELAELMAVGIGRFRLFVSAWPAEEVTELTRLLHKFERSTAEHSKLTPAPRRVRRRGGQR